MNAAHLIASMAEENMSINILRKCNECLKLSLQCFNTWLGDRKGIWPVKNQSSPNVLFPSYIIGFTVYNYYECVCAIVTYNKYYLLTYLLIYLSLQNRTKTESSNKQ